MQDEYDYIVIGAGSAGSVLANRLSADPQTSVLVVEGGRSDKDFMVSMPRGVGVISNEGGKFIQDYPQALTGGNRPPERWFKGKTVGGSSSVNGMVYNRGSPRDYDRWEAAGCPGWGWKDVGPVLKANEDHQLGETEWRGTGGPLKVSVHPKGEPLHEALIAAAGELGVQRAEDINEPRMTIEGSIGYQTATIWQGQRYSAARAFLDPVADRKNLDLAVETKVLRIEFEGGRAVGVRLRDRDGERSVRARREVILSAGAIETPKLLQISGIGPANLLKNHGIEVLRDAGEVGQNLREHRNVMLKYRVRSGSDNHKLGGWRLLLSVLRYVFGKKGPMTHCVHEIGGFVKTDPALPHADMQFNIISITTTDFNRTGKVELEKEPGITLLGYYTRPKSQGEIRITSADPDALPYINANHLNAEVDRQKAVAVVKWLRRLAAQPALKDYLVEELEPSRSVRSDEEILASYINLGGTCYHICGTARMGSDDAAVVDPRLRVRGVTGLRIADTSVMPTLVSANTNACAIMIGTRAASFILEDNAA